MRVLKGFVGLGGEGSEGFCRDSLCTFQWFGCEL